MPGRSAKLFTQPGELLGKILIAQLGRAKAVEAAGIICPLWIVEIGRAARQRVGLNGLPYGIKYICASFHNDDQIAAAGYIEPCSLVVFALQSYHRLFAPAGSKAPPEDR